MKVFITGVSSGIGLGLAKACLERKDEVYGLSRREPGPLMGRAGFHFRSADLGRLDLVHGELAALLDGIKELDLAVLNAGILGQVKDMREIPVDELRHIMDVNVWANKVVLDSLQDLGLRVAQVVAISSGAAVSGARGWNGYSISKAALNMLIKLYAAERPGTHFCALAPGLVDTAMQEHISSLQPDARFPNMDRLRQARGTPAMPQPEEAAPMLIKAFERVKSLESGSFADVRRL